LHDGEGRSRICFDGPAKQREIARKGGKAAHMKGTAHEWTSEEARQAGRKGGMASHKRRKPITPLPEV
jgi:general stress protein YciG